MKKKAMVKVLIKAFPIMQMLHWQKENIIVIISEPYVGELLLKIRELKFVE